MRLDRIISAIDTLGPREQVLLYGHLCNRPAIKAYRSLGSEDPVSQRKVRERNIKRRARQAEHLNEWRETKRRQENLSPPTDR